MKITSVLRSWNLTDQFKFQWAIKRRKTVKKTIAESVLTANGIEVVDINDVIRPAFEEEPYTPIPDEEVVVPEEKPLCYVMTNAFNPLALVPQSQLITKTLVFDSFPSAISDKIEESTAEEEDLCKKILLKSNLLDAEQIKLPRVLDVHKLPGYKPPRTYSIPENKIICSTIQHMFLTLEMKNLKETKHILPSMPSKVSFQHPDGMVQLNHNCTFMIGSKKPLEPIVGNEEAANYDDSPLPDIYPLSPLIHSHQMNNYDLKDEYALSGGLLKPHTIFIAHNPMDLRLRRITPDLHYAKSLMFAFSFAASYAKDRDKGVVGDLKEPVRVNIIHTNGKVFHTGVFQLNTFNFESKRKNFFWHEPLESIYDEIRYDNTVPVVEGLNTRPYQLMKALLN